MAVLYVPHFIQFFDNNGDPLSGGKLYTYTAGTVTPKQTFTNQGGATPNANPLILDSSGRGVMFLDGSYKFRLEDSLGNLIRETDNVTAFSVQSSTVDNIIANFPEDVVVAADSFIFADASDSNTTKRDTIQGLIDLVNASTVGGFKNRVLNGLTLSNNTTDPTNDIDIADGSCVSDDGLVVMTLAAGITKRLDAGWTVGTNQGGLDTGSIADTTYHVWVINRPDTNVTDVLFSTSASSPTLPTNYTKKKCIGSIIRASAAILPFTQRGNKFKLNTPVLDVTVTGTGTAAGTATLASVPSGVVVEALFNTFTSANTIIYYSELTSVDVAPSVSTAPLANFGSGAANHAASLAIFTNTAQQIRYRAFANTNLYIATLGWIDQRI